MSLPDLAAVLLAPTRPAGAPRVPARVRAPAAGRRAHPLPAARHRRGRGAAGRAARARAAAGRRGGPRRGRGRPGRRHRAGAARERGAAAVDGCAARAPRGAARPRRGAGRARRDEPEPDGGRDEGRRVGDRRDGRRHGDGVRRLRREGAQRPDLRRRPAGRRPVAVRTP